MKVINILLRSTDKLCEWLGKFLLWWIFILCLIMVYHVLMRYVFNTPTIWAYDFVYMICGGYGVLALSYTHLRRGHIRIDIIVNRFSPKARLIIELCSYVLLFFPFTIVLMFYSADFALNAWMIKEKSYQTAWSVPIYPLLTTIPISFLLLLLEGLVVFVRDLVQLIWREEI